MQRTHQAPYLHLVSDKPDARLTVRVVGGRGVALEQYEGQPTFFVDLPDLGVDAEVNDLDTLEAMFRAGLDAVRKAREPQQGTPVPRRARRPHVVS